MLTQFMAGGTLLVVGLVVRQLVDLGLGSAGPAQIDGVALALSVLLVLYAAEAFGRTYLTGWIGERVVADLRATLFDRVIVLEPSYFETHRTGELLSRIMADTAMQQTVIGSVLSVAQKGLITVGGIGMLFAISAKLAMVALLVVPAALAPMVKFRSHARRLSRESQTAIARSSGYAEEALNAIETVHAFTHVAVDQSSFRSLTSDSLVVARRRILLGASWHAFFILLVFGAVLAVLWIGGRDVVAGHLTKGDLSAFLFYAFAVGTSCQELFFVWGEVQRSVGAADGLIELLDCRPVIAAPAVPHTLPRPLRGGVEFDRVRFRYPTRPGHWTLNDFSAWVACGQTVAFVGASGAGKTTLFKLLLRFYDPEAGSVRLADVDLRDVDPISLRRRIGVVPQDPLIFAADVRENIAYGQPDATEAEIRAAADAAYATEFIERLPQGFATFLGQRGLRLSIGQRQRIAIARAIVRKPEILLLDEATSAVDAESEALVQCAVASLSTGRTTFIIAHRLATVMRANAIFVMEAGQIVARGTHAELIRQGGLYAKLAALQFIQ